MPPIRSTSRAPHSLPPSNNPQRATRPLDPTAKTPPPIPIPLISGPLVAPVFPVNPVAIPPDTVSHNQEPVVSPEPSTDTQDNSDPSNVTNSRDEIQNPSGPIIDATSRPDVTAPHQLSVFNTVNAAELYYDCSQSSVRITETYNNAAIYYNYQAQRLLDLASRYHESAGHYQDSKLGETVPPPGFRAYCERMNEVAIENLRKGIERQKYGNTMSQNAEACYDLGIAKLVKDERLYDVEIVGVKYSLGWQNYLRTSDLAHQAAGLFGEGVEKYKRVDQLFKEAARMYDSDVESQGIASPVEGHLDDSIVPPRAG